MQRMTCCGQETWPQEKVKGICTELERWAVKLGFRAVCPRTALYMASTANHLHHYALIFFRDLRCHFAHVSPQTRSGRHILTHLLPRGVKKLASSRTLPSSVESLTSFHPTPCSLPPPVLIASNNLRPLLSLRRRSDSDDRSSQVSRVSPSLEDPPRCHRTYV